MPDRRSNRGAHPKDTDCFASEQIPILRRAVSELSWLASRGYSPKASLKLVGDRYALKDRQRRALQRCAAGEAECLRRKEAQVSAAELANQTVLVDGYNVLLTLEAALSGGIVLKARDGVLRDLAAMSAHYRRVHATRPAIHLVADVCRDLACSSVRWLLDRPVSNSGRLRRLIEREVEGRKPPWTVDCVHQVDALLTASTDVVASADSVVLDRCERWFNLAREVVEQRIPDAWVVDLS